MLTKIDFIRQIDYCIWFARIFFNFFYGEAFKSKDSYKKKGNSHQVSFEGQKFNIYSATLLFQPIEYEFMFMFEGKKKL